MPDIISKASASPATPLLALTGVGFFTAAVVAMHFIRPDYAMTTRFVSEYAVGGSGWVMKMAFFALSLGSVALILGLRQTITPSARSSSGLLFLGVWALCAFVAGLFDTNLLGSPETQAGMIHGLASLVAFVSLILSAFLLLKAKRDTRWAPRHGVLLVVVVAMLATFLMFFATITTMPQIAGLMQRIFLAFVLTWLFIMALHSLVLARE